MDQQTISELNRLHSRTGALEQAQRWADDKLKAQQQEIERLRARLDALAAIVSAEAGDGK